MWYTILIAILAIICLVIGLSLIFDWWKPFKEEKSNEVAGENGEKKIEKKIEKAPLSHREKWIVGILTSGIVISLLSLIFVFNPPWLARLREKINGGER